MTASDLGVHNNEDSMSGQSMPPFGKLEHVSARSGWPHEAHEFTPWLADNVELLGDALGLSLELKAREHQIGRYSLDLLLADAAERRVREWFWVELGDAGR
jgi:hypothetical protein